MLLFDGFFGLVMLGLWLFCIIDVITTPESQCRNLPKFVWLLLVLLIPDIGSIAWLVAGRQWASSTSNLPYKGNTGRPQPQRPVRATATNPDDDAEFLLQLRERAEQQRREHRLRSEQERREDPPV